MIPSPLDGSTQRVAYRPGLHRLALIAACMVFPLIFVGAGVTSKEAGMAFPDGFTANGYFWLNPPGWFSAEDTRWEHGHRLLGRAVGLLAILLAVGCWRRGGMVRRMGAANLLVISTQGVLGAFRVNEVSTMLAMIHGVFGQLCFCLSCSVALMTSRTWSQVRTPHEIRSAVFLQRLCLVTTIAVFVQLVFGAAQRHFHCSVSLAIHVLWAIPTAFLVGWSAMWVMGHRQERNLLGSLGQALAVLMALQLVLGGLAYLATIVPGAIGPGLQWALPSAHVAVGALLLAGMVLLTLCTWRLLRPAQDTKGWPGSSAAASAL